MHAPTCSQPSRLLLWSMLNHCEAYLSAQKLLQLLNTTSIAPGRVLSEAFQDERAAWLFHAPSTEGDPLLFFALPVSIIEDATDLLEDLGCAGSKGFSGTFIWRISTEATLVSDVTVSLSASIERVAAVPTTCVSRPSVLLS